MIRLGIVGCNYGRAVLLPAFRADPRCEVVALAGTDAARTAALNGVDFIYAIPSSKIGRASCRERV